MKIIALILGLMMITTASFGHGGDDHGASKTMKTKPNAQGKKFGVRVVWDKDEFLFYPLNANSNPITAGAKLSGTYELFPEGKGKPQALALKSKGEYFSAPIDFKGSYRANIRLKVEHQGISEDLKDFDLEPQE